MFSELEVYAYEKVFWFVFNIKEVKVKFFEGNQTSDPRTLCDIGLRIGVQEVSQLNESCAKQVRDVWIISDPKIPNQFQKW